MRTMLEGGEGKELDAEGAGSVEQNVLRGEGRVRMFGIHQLPHRSL